MFVGPANANSRSANDRNVSSSAATHNRGADCLPKSEPVFEVRSRLARVQSSSHNALLNPELRARGDASATGMAIDSDILLSRPLASVASLSLLEAQRGAYSSATSTAVGAGTSGGGGGDNGAADFDFAGDSQGAGGGGSQRQHNEGATAVFLKRLDIDLQETRRLLHYVRNVSGAGMSGGMFAGGTALGGDGYPGMLGSRVASGGSLSDLPSPLLDTDATGALRLGGHRAESLGRAIRDVQRSMIASERHSATRGGSFDPLSASFTMRGATGPNTPNLGAFPSSLTPGGSFAALPLPGAARALGAVSSGTPAGGGASAGGGDCGDLLPDSVRLQINAQDGLERATHFGAGVVSAFAPLQWLTKFADVAERQAEQLDHGDDLAMLWRNVDLLLARVPPAVSSFLSQDVVGGQQPALIPCVAGRTGAGGGHDPALLAVAGSRQSLERAFFDEMLTRGGFRAHTSIDTIDPTRISEAIDKYCTSGRTVALLPELQVSPWTKTFYAMRIGQWRIASQIIGAFEPAVAAALRDDPRGTDAIGSSRSAALASAAGAAALLAEGGDAAAAVGAALHHTHDQLLALYQNEATRRDHFRAAVLFLLLRGRTAERSGRALVDPGVRAEDERRAVDDLTDIIQHVSSFIDDTLWIRLSLIEVLELCSGDAGGGVEAPLPSLPPAGFGAAGAAGGGAASKPAAKPAPKGQQQGQGRANRAGGPVMMPFHALRDLQNSIRAENPATLFATFGNNAERLANFLFHAVLPATACNVLISRGGTRTVDAVHLALCWYQRGLLADDSRSVVASTSSPEAPFAFQQALRSFVTSYVAAKTRSGVHLGAAGGGGEPPLIQVAYAYFNAVGLHKSFVTLCASDEQFSARIFAPLFASVADMSSASHAGGGNQQRPHHLTAAVSHMDLLTLLNDVASAAQTRGNDRLAAHVAVAAYANAADLVRRNNASAGGGGSAADDSNSAQSIAHNAVTRAYSATNPALARALQSALSQRCALIQPQTEFVVDGTAARAGCTPLPVEVLQLARTVRDVINNVGSLTVLQATGGTLARLTDDFSVYLGVIDVIGAFDDRNWEAAIRHFWMLACIPSTPAQIDATCQMLSQRPEAFVILVGRAKLLVEHALRRRLEQLQGRRGGDGEGFARCEAQLELLRVWFTRWPHRCRVAIGGGTTRM